MERLARAETRRRPSPGGLRTGGGRGPPPPAPSGGFPSAPLESCRPLSPPSTQAGPSRPGRPNLGRWEPWRQRRARGAVATQATTELTPRAIGARIEREPGASGVDAPLPTSRSPKQGGARCTGSGREEASQARVGSSGVSSSVGPQDASESPRGGRGPLRSPCPSFSLGSRPQRGPLSRSLQPRVWKFPAKSIRGHGPSLGPRPISRARHVGCSAWSFGRGGERCIPLLPVDLRNEVGNAPGEQSGEDRRRDLLLVLQQPCDPQHLGC